MDTGVQAGLRHGAVAAVEERVGDRLSLIDINMACPARKVVTKGEGSALMRTPDLAEQIVEAAVGAAHVPVTVKIRKGFYAELHNSQFDTSVPA